MDINDMLIYAKSEILNINENESFTLKDLFKGYEWGRINQGNRRKLGMLFLNYAESMPNIIIRENNKGQKIYTKK